MGGGIMERQYKYDVPLFMCWWEDLIGLYTEQELYEQYKDTNLYEEEEQIGLSGFAKGQEPVDLETFQEVLEYFKQEDWTLNTKFISHNMHIVRVI